MRLPVGGYVAARGGEWAEVRSLNAELDGDDVTEGVHFEEFTVNVGKDARESRQCARDLISPKRHRVRDVVERSVLREQGTESLRIKRASFRHPVGLTNDFFIALHGLFSPGSQRR